MTLEQQHRLVKCEGKVHMYLYTLETILELYNRCSSRVHQQNFQKRLLEDQSRTPKTCVFILAK